MVKDSCFNHSWILHLYHEMSVFFPWLPVDEWCSLNIVMIIKFDIIYTYICLQQFWRTFKHGTYCQVHFSYHQWNSNAGQTYLCPSHQRSPLSWWVLSHSSMCSTTAHPLCTLIQHWVMPCPWITYSGERDVQYFHDMLSNMSNTIYFCY